MRLTLKRRDAFEGASKTKRYRRNLTTKAKKRCKNAKRVWPGRRQTARLAAPFAFAIDGDQNRRSLLKFFRSLRELALERNLKVIIDFSEVDITTVHGTLLFVAELDRIKRILGDQFAIKIDSVKSKRVNQLLEQIGVYSLCSMEMVFYHSDSFDESVRHWRYATGVRVNEQAEQAFSSIEGQLPTELARGMWKSVSEAVVNSCEHAYLEPRGVNGPRLGHARWWMFSQVRDGHLTVAVCDLGIGIPRSLPLRWEASILRKAWDRVSGGGQDLRAIRAALELGASSTGKGHRGKGLPQIWTTLRAVEGASISIASNRAKLVWNGEDAKEFSHEFDTSILATLITWTVKVQEVGNGR